MATVLKIICKNALNNLIFKLYNNLLSTIPYIFMIYKNIPSTDYPRCSLWFLGPVFTRIKGLVREGLLTQFD